MKTETTKALEHLLLSRFKDRSEFYVFECTIGWYGKEIVDCVCYDCNRTVMCFEIKSSVADFRSKASKTFIGNKNYYVMPYSVYEKVKDEIPLEVGVLAAVDKVDMMEEKEWFEGGVRYRGQPVDGMKFLHSVKPCRSVDLKADKEVILSSMLRCMQRDINRGSRFAHTDSVGTGDERGGLIDGDTSWD